MADDIVPFEIRMNGQVIHTVEIPHQLVTGIHVYGPNGEASASGFGLTQNYVNLVLDMQSPTSLEIVEEVARLDKAQRVQDALDSGELVEPLYTNENARRLEAVAALEADQAERAKNSDEDLSQQFAIEREEAIRNPSSILGDNLAPTVAQNSEEADLNITPPKPAGKAKKATADV